MTNKIITLFLLMCYISAHATNKYVAKNGSDNNSGTCKTPFQSIQKGLDVAKSGDSVFVKAGTYQEYVQFPSNGKIGKPIVLKNYSNDSVTIDAQSKRAYCIYAIDKGYLIIDGINVLNSTSYNVFFSGCNHISYKNATSILQISNTYATAGAKGILIQPSTTNWGTDITIKNITSIGGQYGFIAGNKLKRVNIIGGHFSYASIDGISIATPLTVDTSLFNRNFIIDGTEIHHNLRQGIVTWGLKKATFKKIWSHNNGATGIQIENLSSNILIEDFISENNTLGGGFETGVWIDDSDSVTVRRGIMRNNQCGFRVSNSKNVLAYNLLIYSNNYFKAPPYVNNSSGINFYSNPIEITNNIYICHVELCNSIIYNNSNTNSQRGTVVLQGSGTYIFKNIIIASDQSTYDIFRTGTHTLISDNNLIYNARALNIYYNPHSSSKHTASMTWSSYKRITEQDIHSINADPRFVDAKNNDFRIRSNSPYITLRTNVGLTEYLGNPIKGLADTETYYWVDALFKRFNIQ